MNAKILTNEPQADPLWMRAIDRYGIAVVGWVAVGIAVWTWGGKWVDVTLDAKKLEQAETSQFLQAQIAATKAQTAAIEKLTEAAGIERDFESKVFDVHETQTEILAEIRDCAADTNDRMASAEEAMAGVPDQRAEELVILKEIRDGLTDDGGT